MGFCKENENTLCKPFSCRMAQCPIGEKLRQENISKKCKEVCIWISQGINGVNSCKDSSCPIGNVIVEFGKK